MSSPKIILYTSYACPWAHRAQTALHELGLTFETVHIDLSVPRTAEYLAINPRGLVPSISYNGTIITESAIVSGFLADAHPSHLVKASNAEGGALQRAKYAFAVSTFFEKVNPGWFAVLQGKTEEDRETAGQKYADTVKKEFESLLEDAGPYFGGAEKFTLVEVLIAPFVIRLLAFSKYPEIAPKSLLTSLEAKAPAFWKWANLVSKQESVTYIWDEKKLAESTLARVQKARAAN